MNKQPFNNEINQLANREDSFPQNPFFTEKNLELKGMTPPFDGDNDVRTITRQKVVNTLNNTAIANLDPIMYVTNPPETKSSNEWIYQHCILSEVPITLFQVYMKSNLSNNPIVFFTRYRALLNIQRKLSWFSNKDIEEITESDLLDPTTLKWLFQNFSQNESNRKLLNQLNNEALRLNYITEPFQFIKAVPKEKLIHPKVLSYSKMKSQSLISQGYIHTSCQSIYEFFNWLLQHERLFFTYNVSNIPINLITNKHLQDYKRFLVNLITEGKQSNTNCSHKLYHLIDFFKYLVRTFGYDNPLQNFKTISAPRYRPRKIPSDHQILNLFKVIREYSTDPIGETIAYLFMYELGLRLGEVALISWKDINLELKTITIHAKGNKSHLLPLTLNLHTYLIHYQQKSNTNDWLFNTAPTSAKNTLYTKFKIYSLIAGWSFPGGVHLFRHMFITRLARDFNVPPQLLKALARVSELDTVSLYLQLGLDSNLLNEEINKLKF